MTTPTQYNGVGYIDQPIQDSLPYITQYSIPQQFLYNTLLKQAQLFSPSITDLNGFFAQYSVNNPLPSDIDSFASAFATFYNLGSVYGAEADQMVKNAIINSNQAAIQTNPNSFGDVGPQDDDYDPLIDPIGTIIQQPTFNEDMATRSFNDFLKTFEYSDQQPANSALFQEKWGNYYATVANTRTGYLNLFTAFFSNSTRTDGTTDFENALADYITNIMYPSGGSSEAFLPSHNYGDFFEEMVNQYEKAISGSNSTYETQIGPSVKGARILNTIFDLIVSMITTLQVVTAAQADRLKFLTQWQQGYTDLQGQIRSFVKSGPEWIQDDDDSRGQLNQANQTYTQEIQARMTVVNDDSKQLQTNVNQSNDTVNQQTSVATAIIQQLTSLLTAIYK